MRKWKNLCMAGAMVLFMGILVHPAHAELVYDSSDEILQAGGMIDSESGQGLVPRYRQAVADASALTVEDVLYQGMLAGTQEIDISSYNIMTSELKTIYTNVLNSHADLFFVGRQWKYYTYGNKVTSVLPTYTLQGEELEKAKAEYDAMAKEILDQVEDDWSDVEKALFLHDYLCTAYGYDTTYKIYDAYNMMKQKKGVCQAYTLLYGYLLQQCGITSEFATSVSMNHIWNVIDIDDEWYHVDVTWDDALTNNKDVPGRALHNNFLRSETGIKEQSHYSWSSNVTAESSKYEDAFWKEVRGPIVYSKGGWYYVAGNLIKKCSINDIKVIQTAYVIPWQWILYEDEYYTKFGYYSGIGAYGDILYLNSPDAIYTYDPASASLTQIYAPKLEENKNIYGLTMHGNTITYIIAEDPETSAVKTQDYQVEKIEKVPEVRVSFKEDKGAAVCSGKVLTPAKLAKNLGIDVTVMRQKTVIGQADNIATGDILTAGGTSYEIVRLGDLNGDGVINVNDMESIQKHLLGIAKVSGVYLEAGKLNGQTEDSLSVLDMERVQKYILGLSVQIEK